MLRLKAPGRDHVHFAAQHLLKVEFEVRQDLIGTREGAEEWAETLAAVLQRLREELAPLAIEHRIPTGAGAED